MTDQHLRMIRMRDIDGYQEYLMQYYVTDEETGESVVKQNHELGIMRKLCSLRWNKIFSYHMRFLLLTIAEKIRAWR